MAVLVIGGTGFVGFNVVETLLAAGREVVVLDRGALLPLMQRAVAGYSKSLTVEQGDILDTAALQALFARRRIEGVIHCAVVTSGPEREACDPANIFEVNLRGTINVLAAARDAKVKRLVYVSSGSAYGESRDCVTGRDRMTQLNEATTPALPYTLYGITKFAAERTCLRLGKLWQIDVVCARLGTQIGPWERATGVRDSFNPHSQLALYAATSKAAILPRHEVRVDAIYSRDTAAGLIALLDAPGLRYTLYNLSSGYDWAGSLLAWCEELKSVYKSFQYRTADSNETQNIDRDRKDRYSMDVGRIVHDIAFKAREPVAARTDFLDWIKCTPDFWQLNVP